MSHLIPHKIRKSKAPLLVNSPPVFRRGRLDEAKAESVGVVDTRHFFKISNLPPCVNKLGVLMLVPPALVHQVRSPLPEYATPYYYLYNMVADWKIELVAALLNRDSAAMVSIKQPFIPKRLFKYCPLNDYSLKNITDSSIWLSYPEKVNDPYDTSITVSIKRLGNDSFRNGNYWENLKKYKGEYDFTDDERNFINESDDCAEAFKSLLIEKYPYNKNFIEVVLKEQDERKHREALDNFNSHQRNQLRFCSFSERLDSVLMWSHYASNHTGICIEYDFSTMPNLLQFLYPIIYDNIFFDWTPHMDDPMKGNAAKIIAAIHKAKDWEYEKEWRLLSGRENNVTTIMTTLPKIKPTAIYFGSKLDFDSKIFEELKKQCESQKIPASEMILSRVKFQMESRIIYAP
jgi:hypothetical protein